ncbi:MAG: SDR family NAD(P)-dependent oxidoreductase, partial [Anaerolineae bacterium]|nr:SDR family NAD(P)-dependent oxidoreductase [Anaerolineae bacterium]
GVRAAALIGHSLGEYVAACLAGVFSLGDALALVAVRGRLMQQLPGGAMLAISLPGSEVQSSLSRGLSLAAINGPNQCVISGPVAAVEALQQRLDHEAVTYRRLPTSHAFHSEMMEPILDAYLAQVKKVDLQPPQLPYVSNLTGTWITAAEATDPHYWIKHIRQPVRFAAGLGELLAEPANILLEIGPGWTLTTLAKRQKETPLDQVALTSLPQPLAQESEVKSILTTLGRLWLAGVAIDWPGLYVHEQRQRLPLPTYPFERQRYWIDPPDTNPTPAATGRQADIADWFYIPSWKRSVVSTAEHEGQTRSCWLLFVDDWGLGDRLAERLVQGHHDVIIVKPGAEFTKVDDRLYLLNPRQREDYQTLLNQPILLAKKPTKIVHLWSVTTTQDSSALDVDEAQTVGFYSLLYLAQALDDSGLTDALDLTVISNQMQDVTGAEQLCPAKATMLGPIKVIPQEYRNLSCRSVDIEVEMLGAAGEQTLLDHLLVELSGGKTEAVVAYRGKHRWVQTFEPIRLEGSDHPPSHLKVGGVYLITGGLGGVGLALAEYLAQTVQANLILTGRSPVPTRAAWDEWLAGHDEQDPLSRKIRNIQALEALGSELLVLQADVTDEERMKWVIAQSLARFGQIDGVIHAAGVLNADLIRHKTPEAAASTFAPKLKGTQVLMGLCDAIEPNFMLFCASLSSVIGGLGLADYAAANAYLDAAAQALSRRGTFAASISWDAWREVGMAQDIDPDMQQYLPETGLSPTEGKELFGRILGGNLSHVLVSTHNLGLRVAHSLPPRHPGNSLDTSVSQPRPELASVYVPPHNETEQKLAVIWQELLGFEQVGIHDNFFELGGDSLLSIQVIARAKQAGLQITIKDLLQHQTLKELADMAKPVDTIPSDSHSPDGNISFDRQVNNQTSPTLNEDTIPSEEGWSSLVALQPQGSVLPLFCVHPLLGVVFPYLQLAHNMGREQPFYGLQAVGLDGRQPPLTCFEDMAAHYIKAIRTVQPDGPYCLGGWSLGSWIAFEMAQQLQAAGDEVGLLAIIDTAAGIRTGSQWQRFRSAWALNTVIVRNIWPFVRDYFSLGTIRTRPSSTRDKGQTTISDGSSLMRWKQPIVRDMLNVWRANMRANSQYSPQPYSGSITVFRAIEENYQKGTTLCLNWDTLSQNVTAVDIPGNHFTALREPNVNVLAQRLRECMPSEYRVNP